MNKLSVNLVAWNGVKYIPHLFASLRAQTFSDWELNILDNCSTDGTVSVIQRELKNNNQAANVICNSENKGFAAGHNQLFRASKAEYFLILNQDMYLTADALEKIIKFLDEDKTRSAVAPRLMKWNFLDIDAGLEQSFTDLVDSVGLSVSRRRRIRELHGGESWPINECADKKFLEVFGLSGALLAMRRDVAEKIQFRDGSLFDESYHSYKEDVDLAFRLRSAGFSSFVLLDTVVYHDRSAAQSKNASDVSAAGNKMKQSFFIKYYSYKNHLATLYKNEYWQNIILDFGPILWYEAKKFIYYLITQPSILMSWRALWKERKLLCAKRLEIKRKRTIGWREVRKWWKY